MVRKSYFKQKIQTQFDEVNCISSCFLRKYLVVSKLSMIFPELKKLTNELIY
jgi:hypothetical protein